MINLIALFAVVCMPHNDRCQAYLAKCYTEALRKESVLKAEPQKAQAVLYCMQRGGYVKF
jgi:hypothetical protein